MCNLSIVNLRISYWYRLLKISSGVCLTNYIWPRCIQPAALTSKRPIWNGVYSLKNGCNIQKVSRCCWCSYTSFIFSSSDLLALLSNQVLFCWSRRSPTIPSFCMSVILFFPGAYSIWHNFFQEVVLLPLPGAEVYPSIFLFHSSHIFCPRTANVHDVGHHYIHIVISDKL